MDSSSSAIDWVVEQNTGRPDTSTHLKTKKIRAKLSEVKKATQEKMTELKSFRQKRKREREKRKHEKREKKIHKMPSLEKLDQLPFPPIPSLPPISPISSTPSTPFPSDMRDIEIDELPPPENEEEFPTEELVTGTGLEAEAEAEAEAETEKETERIEIPDDKEEPKIQIKDLEIKEYTTNEWNEFISNSSVDPTRSRLPSTLFTQFQPMIKEVIKHDSEKFSNLITLRGEVIGAEQILIDHLSLKGGDAVHERRLRMAIEECKEINKTSEEIEVEELSDDSLENFIYREYTFPPMPFMSVSVRDIQPEGPEYKL